jgi:hypothetical protein
MGLALRELLTKRRATPCAGQNCVGRDLVTTGRAVKPVTAETALLFRKALLFFAFRAAAIHLPLTEVVGKKQAAPGAFTGPRFMNNRLAAGDRAFEDSFAVFTPVFTF